MFVETDRPPPSGLMAEGAYWLFMPIGIVLTTPGLVWVLASLLQQELAFPLAWMVDQYQALVLVPFIALGDAAKTVLPGGWSHWGGMWAHPIAVFSFGGGAYVAAWYAAGLQRAFGFLGFIVALAMMFALGLTLLGAAYLVLAYLIVTDGAGAVFFIQGDENDLAIALPLLAPPVLAGLLLAANALV